MKKINRFVCEHITKRFPMIEKIEGRKARRLGIPYTYLLAYVRDESPGIIGRHLQDFLFNYFLIKIKVEVIWLNPISDNECDSDWYDHEDYYERLFDEDEVIDSRGRRFPL
jgi:hypothetical protein